MHMTLGALGVAVVTYNYFFTLETRGYHFTFNDLDIAKIPCYCHFLSLVDKVIKPF